MRGYHNALAIGILNVFLGWIIALVWAFTQSQRPVQVVQVVSQPYFTNPPALPESREVKSLPVSQRRDLPELKRIMRDFEQ